MSERGGPATLRKKTGESGHKKGVGKECQVGKLCLHGVMTENKGAKLGAWKGQDWQGVGRMKRRETQSRWGGEG